MKIAPYILSIGITLIAIGIILMDTDYHYAKTNLNKALLHALQECVDKDLAERMLPISASSSGFKANRKVKTAEITTYNEATQQAETDTIVFRDSIDQNIYENLTKQYVLAKLNPIRPDTLLKLFKQELKERHGVDMAAGITYWDGKQAHYSGNDSATYAQPSYCVRIDSLDIYYQLWVEARTNCGIGTIMRFGSPMGYIALIALAAGLLTAGLTLFLQRNKKKGKNLKEEIKTDLAAGTVTIAENSYSLPPLEIRLLDLFLNHPYRVLNKEEIKRQIWESESVTDNTLYVHITKIKNLLQPHSYTITNIRNCGYRLERVS